MTSCHLVKTNGGRAVNTRVDEPTPVSRRRIEPVDSEFHASNVTASVFKVAGWVVGAVLFTIIFTAWSLA